MMGENKKLRNKNCGYMKLDVWGKAKAMDLYKVGWKIVYHDEWVNCISDEIEESYK